MNHTPTPYRLSNSKIDICSGNDNIMNASTLYRDMREVEATAAFIVRACNSHDKLLFLLKAVFEDEHNKIVPE